MDSLIDVFPVFMLGDIDDTFEDILNLSSQMELEEGDMIKRLTNS
jgi:hypothetical protein